MATVTKRGNSYSIRVSDGYRSSNDQIRKNFTWTPPAGLTEKQEEKELAKQISKYEDLVKTGRVADGNIKFEAFADKWLDLHAEKQLAPKTVFGYRKLLVRVNEAIGHVRLDRLQPAQLIEFYNNLSEAGVREDTKYKATAKLAEAVEAAKLNGSQLARKASIGNSTAQIALSGGNISRKSAESITKALEAKLSDLFTPVEIASNLSGNSILHYHRVISSILSTAVEWQIITANPAERVRAPRAEPIEAKYLDEVEAKQVIKLLDPEPIQYRTMITLLMLTGLRRGELCGLKWSDIDFEKHLLSVRRAIQYLPQKGLFETEPKRGSKRVIKLSILAVRLLLEYRNAQTSEKEACGDQWLDNDLVFTRWNGSFFNPDDLTSWFHAFIQSHNLSKATPHSLRHTNATLMIAAGTDLRTVSKRLGHAQTSTTSNIYAHAIRSADEAAAEAIEDIFEPTKQAAKKKATADRNQQKAAKISAISHK